MQLSIQRLAQSLALIAFAALPVCLFGQGPDAIESELAGELKKLSNSAGSGTAADPGSVTASNGRVLEILENAAGREDVLRHRFTRLDGLMWITTSPDGNLRIYSWDNQQGGTMRYFNSVFQFRTESGKVGIKRKTTDAEGGATPFYHAIFETRASSGIVYLANYTAIASSSLSIQGLRALRIVDGQLDEIDLFGTREGTSTTLELQYDFASVADRPERPVSLFEIGRQGSCMKHPSIDESEDSPTGGKVTDRFIVYVLEKGRYVEKPGATCFQ
ncbi:MAG: hypothetical protein DWQ43_03000 [Acidobacteria bacterium]|nr:MAG: hypothetical protein DWQ38_14685 [Acidobacteriota bacterium]REK15989.1 MAG: hypothetical protein DWQ43_03000 [Acidobacteriota bacterium]